MVPRFLTATLCAGLFSGAAPPPTCDMTGYRPQPGLEAFSQDGSLNVRWDGEKGQELLAKLAIVNGTPTVRELAVRKKGGEWATVGRDLVPEFSRDDRRKTNRAWALIRKPLGRFLGRTAEQCEGGSPIPSLLSCRPLCRSGQTGLGWKSRSQG